MTSTAPSRGCGTRSICTRGSRSRSSSARSRLAYGSALRRARQKAAARAALEAAARGFDAVGARVWADRARAELARVGGRPPSSGALTPTERRVAELVAAGAADQAGRRPAVRLAEDGGGPPLAHLRQARHRLAHRARPSTRARRPRATLIWIASRICARLRACRRPRNSRACCAGPPCASRVRGWRCWPRCYDHPHADTNSIIGARPRGPRRGVPAGRLRRAARADRRGPGAAHPAAAAPWPATSRGSATTITTSSAGRAAPSPTSIAPSAPRPA